MEVEMIFEKLDFNQNGSIDYTEFMIANIDKDRLLQEDLLNDAFKLFDIDGSGSISVEELKKVLGANSAIEEEEWEEILAEVDDDGNGEIEFNEFKAVMYKLLERAPASVNENRSERPENGHNGEQGMNL